MTISSSRFGAAIALAAPVLLLSGCIVSETAGPSDGDRPVHSTAPPPPRSETKVPPAKPTDSAAALNGFDVQAKVPAASSVLAVAPNGDALIKSVDGSRGLTVRASADGAVTALTEAPGQGGAQAITGDVSARYTVWMQTNSQEINVQPWDLYAYDRHTGTTRLLTSAPEMDTGGPPPPPPGFTGPVLGGKHVFWVQVSGRPGAVRSDVYGCEVDDCHPRPYLTGSAYPAATAGGLYAIRGERYAGADRSDQMQVLRIGLNGEEEDVVASANLTRDQEPGGLAASVDGFAWIITEPGRSTINIQAEHLDAPVAFSEPGMFGFPVASKRFVAWAESSGTSPKDIGGYLYDLKRERLFTLGNTSGLYNVQGDGSTVAWQSATNAGTITTVIARLR